MTGHRDAGGAVPDAAAGRARWDSTRSRLLLVFVGAALGTMLRAALGRAFPAAPGGWPWATFGVNLAGSLLLGLLLQALVQTGDDAGWRRALRLGCGTGVLGGFTTYSTFVLEVGTLADHGRPAVGAGYAVVSVVLGVAAAGLGVWLATRLGSDRLGSGQVGPGQVGPGQVGPGQVGPGQVGAAS